MCMCVFAVSGKRGLADHGLQCESGLDHARY